MSAYCTASQIYAKIPQPKVNDALDDDGDGQADTGLLDALIANASNEVDAALQARYAVPFSAPVPALCVQCALVFSCEEINRRRELIGDKNPFTAEANKLREKLRDIAARKIPLDTTTEPESPGAQQAGLAPLALRIDL